MARFRCNLSGNIFEFTAEYDIADMREHPQYTEVEEVEEETVEPVVEKKTTVSLKKTKKDKQV